MSILTPVRYPAKFYSWQDKEAPVLEDKDGVIKTILKACLVTGYGEKQGAGYTITHDENNEMTLIAPKDDIAPIVIKHGLVNDEPVVMRDSSCGREWYLVGCDFGFILCYQMGYQNYKTNQNNLLIVCQCASLDNKSYPLMMSSHYYSENGYAGTWQYTIFNSSVNNLKNKTDNTSHFVASLNLNHTTQLDLFMPCFSDNAKLPIFVHLCQNAPTDTQIITSNGRSFLRYFYAPVLFSEKKVIYIPTDYWEL